MLKMSFVVLAMAVLGGQADSQELTWQEMAPLPRPVAGYMAGVARGRLLIIGGSYWQDKQKHWSNLVQAFDPKSNRWSNEASLPEPRSDAASATLNDDVYFFGGGSSDDVRSDALVLHGGKWSAVPNGTLPEPRLYATAISFDGYIYLLGGMSAAGKYQSVSNGFSRWKPNAKAWETLPPLPGPGRISHAMVAISGKIYVFGGATTGPKDVENLKDAYEYDPSSRRWTRLPDLPVANRAWWAVGLGGRALLLGGYTDDFARKVYVYTPGKSLEPAGSLPHAVADAKFFRTGSAVLGAGGEAGPGIRSQWTFLAHVPRVWLKQGGN